jgi:hypothetical protein
MLLPTKGKYGLHDEAVEAMCLLEHRADINYRVDIVAGARVLPRRSGGLCVLKRVWCVTIPQPLNSADEAAAGTPPVGKPWLDPDWVRMICSFRMSKPSRRLSSLPFKSGPRIFFLFRVHETFSFKFSIFSRRCPWRYIAVRKPMLFRRRK